MILISGILNVSLLVINENNYCEAIKCYARVIEYQPSDVMTHNEMALAYKNMGQIDKALECFKQILLIDHDLWWAKFNIAERRKIWTGRNGRTERKDAEHGDGVG